MVHVIQKAVNYKMPTKLKKKRKYQKIRYQKLKKLKLTGISSEVLLTSTLPKEMQVEKMEVDAKSVRVKQEIEDDSDQKMDMGVQGVKREIVENEAPLGGDAEVSAAHKKEDDTIIKIIPKEAGQAYLTVDGMIVEGDESVTMTAEEVRSYIEKAVFDHIVNNNPLAALNKHTRDIHAELKEKRDEFQKLARLIDIIERDQLKFLRTDKTLRKYLTKTGGVGVELPVLPNSLPDESLLKRGFVQQAPAPTSNKPTSRPAKTPTTTLVPTSAPVHTLTPVPVTKLAPATAKPAASVSAEKTPKPGESIECIDLTDESEISSAAAKKNPSSFSYIGLVKHPAPLPPKPFLLTNKNLPPIPPKPRLKISSEERGIVLQWDMIPNPPNNANYAGLQSFDIFGYQEQKNIPINTLLWKKIGSVKAMTLPMACTLTQFIEGNKYHFSIRAVDVHNRCGCYSDPISIVYNTTKS